MTIDDIFNFAVVIFTVGNLAAMGLELNVPDAIHALRNRRFVALTLAWSWLVGPALAFLITKILPLSEPFAMGLLLASPAPCAPFYPLVVRKARGNVAHAAAFLLLTAVGTVLMMPLMVPLLVKGISVSAWAIAKPLVVLVLIPMLVGISLRAYLPRTADNLFPVVKRIAGIATLAVLILVLVLYGRGMLNSVGGFAVGAQILFLGGMTVLSYKIGLGMEQNVRSVMALGIGTRNIAAVFAVLMAIPSPDPDLVIMVVLVVPLSVMVAFAAAKWFSKESDETTMRNNAT